MGNENNKGKIFFIITLILFILVGYILLKFDDYDVEPELFQQFFVVLVSIVLIINLVKATKDKQTYYIYGLILVVLMDVALIYRLYF